MLNGFIYPLFDLVVKFLYYCNLVELFKFIAKLYTKLSFQRNDEIPNQKDIIKSCNIAIDIFQVLKWSVLSAFWICETNNTFSLIIIYYLLFSNLFTYFYYHVWGSKYQKRTDRDTLNRKFLSAMLAISYYIFCYGYLYQIHYSSMIQWPDNLVDFTNAIYLSVANAFTLTYGGFAPLTQEIRVIFMSELINTFLFFTVIITNSVPNHVGDNQE